MWFSIVRDAGFVARGGAVALVCDEGRVESGDVIVRPPDLAPLA